MLYAETDPLIGELCTGNRPASKWPAVCYYISEPEVVEHSDCQHRTGTKHRQVRAVSTATADCLRRVEFEGLIDRFAILAREISRVPCKVECRVVVGWGQI